MRTFGIGFLFPDRRALELLVRLRPNVPYPLFVLAAVACIAYGVAWIVSGGVFGVVAVVGGLVLLALFGLPIVVSTVFRPPTGIDLSSGHDRARQRSTV